MGTQPPARRRATIKYVTSYDLEQQVESLRCEGWAISQILRQDHVPTAGGSYKEAEVVLARAV
jgi:hypothetical protein